MKGNPAVIPSFSKFSFRHYQVLSKKCPFKSERSVLSYQTAHDPSAKKSAWMSRKSWLLPSAGLPQISTTSAAASTAPGVSMMPMFPSWKTEWLTYGNCWKYSRETNCDSGKEYRYATHEQIKKTGMVVFPEWPGTQGVQHALPPLRPRLQAEFPGGCRCFL